MVKNEDFAMEERERQKSKMLASITWHGVGGKVHF